MGAPLIRPVRYVLTSLLSVLLTGGVPHLTELKNKDNIPASLVCCEG